MSADALSPFGRAARAPLAGRTILQIVPALAAGGDQQTTLAVAAALVEAGARAMVACDSYELASEVQAVGGLHLPLPASTKNPFAMAFNSRRLARILESERIDLVHARSRAAAWVALGACRKTKRPLVTIILGITVSTSLPYGDVPVRSYAPQLLSENLFGPNGPWLLLLGLIMLTSVSGAIYLVREGRE